MGESMLRVLGGITFEDRAGHPVRLSSGQRRLLAALAIGEGRVVRAEALGDVAGLSGSALRTSLSRLRGRVGIGVIATDGAGYRLGCDTDASRFRRLMASGSSFPERLEELEFALSLWSGSAYEEFASESWAQLDAVQLDELRLVAIEDCAALQISHRVRIGQAVATLTPHVAANPLRDRACGLLMEALAADGRQADALRAYQGFRAHLLEATGTEPSDDVRAIERRIATQGRSDEERPRGGSNGGLAVRPGSFSPASSLPNPRNALLGRNRECEEVASLLGPSRIVTLMGPGGVGKTRLAIELSRRAASEYRDGAAWCDLAAIDDPTALPAMVASTLSITMSSHDSITAAIVDGLSGRESLLLFDNCEHLLDAAGALLVAIAEDCAGVAIIATSRRPLGIDGEQVWPLQPLDPTGAGVDLFVERALAAGAGSSVALDRDALAALCRRLDGLPLAIELAAPRMRTMSPAEMLERLGPSSLEENLGLVSRKSGRGPTRHRALVDTLDWSYNLLDSHEQTLLARLAVFAGGFDQRAVEAVCGTGSDSDAAILEALAGLVDQSMISFERTEGVTRYRLLDTIRAYARLKLNSQDEHEVAQRHLEYYGTLVTDSVSRWRSDHRSAVGVFDDDWDNIRIAIQRALSMADAEALDRLLECLAWPSLWSVRLEIDTWASEAVGLAACNGATMGLAAHTAALRGQTDRASQLAARALAAAEHEADPSTHHAWAALFLTHTDRGDHAAARAAAASAHVSMRAAYGDFGDAFWSAIIAFLDAKADPRGAAEHARRAEQLIGSVHNPALSGEVLSMLARHYGRAGDPSRGIACCREALALADRYHLSYCRNSASAALAYLASVQGAAGAPRDIAEALARAHHDRLWFWVWQSVVTASRWLAEAGDLHTAAVLVGHIDAHGHGNIGPSVRHSIAAMPDSVAVMSEGARLHRDSIVALALERLPVAAPT